MSDLPQPQLDRIESKLDRLLGAPLPEVIGLREAMRLCGVRSKPAFYRLRDAMGVVPYKKDGYRRTEIMNGISRQALNKKLQLQKQA